MAAKKATKTPGVDASLYEGHLDLSYNCVGVEACRYALCSMMPPDGSEECTYREHGSCLCPHAKHAALEALSHKIKKEMKQIEEDCQG